MKKFVIKYKSVLLIIIALVFSTAGIAYAVNYNNFGYRVDSSTSNQHIVSITGTGGNVLGTRKVDVSEWNKCKIVSNATNKGDAFIPTKTDPEWQSVITASTNSTLPQGLTLSACVTQCFLTGVSAQGAAGGVFGHGGTNCASGPADGNPQCARTFATNEINGYPILPAEKSLAIAAINAAQWGSCVSCTQVFNTGTTAGGYTWETEFNREYSNESDARIGYSLYIYKSGQVESTQCPAPTISSYKIGASGSSGNAHTGTSGNINGAVSNALNNIRSTVPTGARNSIIQLLNDMLTSASHQYNGNQEYWSGNTEGVTVTVSGTQLKWTTALIVGTGPNPCRLAGDPPPPNTICRDVNQYSVSVEYK